MPGQSSMQYFIRRHSTGFYLLPFKGKSRDFSFLVAILQASSVLPIINSVLPSSRGAGSRRDEQHENTTWKEKVNKISLYFLRKKSRFPEFIVDSIVLEWELSCMSYAVPVINMEPQDFVGNIWSLKEQKHLYYCRCR